jgi:hypothetical protein
MLIACSLFQELTIILDFEKYARASGESTNYIHFWEHLSNKK